MLQARAPGRSRPTRPPKSKKPKKSKEAGKPSKKEGSKGHKANKGIKSSKPSKPSKSVQSSHGAQATPIVFPKLDVPYVDTATDLCDLWIDCGDESDYAETEVLRRQEGHHSRQELWKRDDRTVNADLPSGKLVLKTLAYPSSGILYSPPRHNNPVHAFNFKSNRLGSTLVRDSSRIPATTTAYATEHIIELQSVPMFMEYAIEKNAKLEPFFQNHWTQRVGQISLIRKRSPRPAYRLGTRPPRDSLGSLVFEALGTTHNPTNFVLCSREINMFKEHLWAQKNLMGLDLYNTSLTEAMEGIVPSSVFLSGLRTSFAVYHYMNSHTVQQNLRSINSNVRMELSHAKTLTGEEVDLVPLWDSFLEDRFTIAENHGKDWLRGRIERALKEIKETRKKYRTLLTQLQKQEKGKLAEQHRKKQHQKQLSFEKLRENAKRKVVHQRALISQLTKKYEAITNPTKAQTKAFNSKVTAAKKTMLRHEKMVMKAQRRIHVLYAYSLEGILRNLRKDQQRVLAFEKAIPALRLLRP
ncbi:hypothetical protein SLS60_007163 [Paraconiothyrium brasiliense]|uniref:Uncharacterized protein n=1 Tax=Paraconiothyrium brasiliense TaxID=300254 RepID=A0ABR3R8J8_9PLEO